MRIKILLLLLLGVSSCTSRSKKGYQTSIYIETVYQKFHSDTDIEPVTTKEYHFLSDKILEIDLIGRKNNTYMSKRYLKKEIKQEGLSEIISIQIVNLDKKRMIFNSPSAFINYLESEGYIVKTTIAKSDGNMTYLFQQVE